MLGKALSTISAVLLIALCANQALALQCNVCKGQKIGENRTGQGFDPDCLDEAIQNFTASKFLHECNVNTVDNRNEVSRNESAFIFTCTKITQGVKDGSVVKVTRGCTATKKDKMTDGCEDLPDSYKQELSSHGIVQIDPESIEGKVCVCYGKDGCNSAEAKIGSFIVSLIAAIIAKTVV